MEVDEAAKQLAAEKARKKHEAKECVFSLVHNVSNLRSLTLLRKRLYEKKAGRAKKVICNQREVDGSSLFSNVPTRYLWVPNFGAGSGIEQDNLTAFFQPVLTQSLLCGF